MTNSRRTATNGALMWGAGGMAFVVLALTGYAIFSGDDSTTNTGKGGTSTPSASASPTPGYNPPPDWTEPDRWAALPRGRRTDENGNAVGFPHTTEGAVAMMAAANTTTIEGDRSTVDEQLGIYRSYVTSEDQTDQNAEQIEGQAKKTDKKIQRQMGVGPDADLPPGAHVRNWVVGFKVIKAADDEVSVWLLSRSVTKTGETKPEEGGYTRTLLAAEWVDDDWKLTGDSITRAAGQTRGLSKPDMVAPGDTRFNLSEWTAIREAS
ncbi:hypothetical protein [Streptomyces sp.]|uniref:hypothetical protein n=1 Tax=Streptomyces sp. TaxID=1931 RepID=UPI002F9535CC